MGSQSYLKALIICLIAVIGSTEAQLQLGFYAKSCPNAEKIILKYVAEHIRNVPSLAAALIRLHFHDCFVNVWTCLCFIFWLAWNFEVEGVFNKHVLSVNFRVVMDQCFWTQHQTIKLKRTLFQILHSEALASLMQ